MYVPIEQFIGMYSTMALLGVLAVGVAGTFFGYWYKQFRTDNEKCQACCGTGWVKAKK